MEQQESVRPGWDSYLLHRKHKPSKSMGGMMASGSVKCSILMLLGGPQCPLVAHIWLTKFTTWVDLTCCHRRGRVVIVRAGGCRQLPQLVAPWSKLRSGWCSRLQQRPIPRHPLQSAAIRAGGSTAVCAVYRGPLPGCPVGGPLVQAEVELGLLGWGMGVLGTWIPPDRIAYSPRVSTLEPGSPMGVGERDG